jgi:hypothetical protein
LTWKGTPQQVQSKSLRPQDVEFCLGDRAGRFRKVWTGLITSNAAGQIVGRGRELLIGRDRAPTSRDGAHCAPS